MLSVRSAREIELSIEGAHSQFLGTAHVFQILDLASYKLNVTRVQDQGEGHFQIVRCC